MATRTTVLRNTGLVAQAGQSVAKGTGAPVVKFARYITAAGEARTLKGLKVLSVGPARENGLLIMRTADALGNVRSYNTGRLTHAQITGL